MTFFAELDGQRLVRVQLRVPQRGAWYALCDFERDPSVSGRAVLTLGAMRLSGTVVPEYAGAFGEQRRLLLVGGANGWGTVVVPRGYHNDASLKAVLIVQDVAREVGETLGSFTAEAERIGIDYVRGGVERQAVRVLEDVIGEALWWVDYNGVTHVGMQRPTAPPLLEDDYRVLQFDPRARLAELSVSDPSVLHIGSVITGPSMDAPQTVREIEIQASSEGLRVLAWCGGSERSAGRLAGLWRKLVTQFSNGPLTGLYRYRVVSQSSDGRVSLQAVRVAAGLPDIAHVAQWPGVAGVHAELTPGVEVLVAFVEGDRTMPVLTHYAGVGATGFVPVGLTLGGSSGPPAARQGDAVEIFLPPGTTLSGTVQIAPPPAPPAPLVGVLTWPASKTMGIITAGSAKVRIA